jgi:hypothetical protein
MIATIKPIDKPIDKPIAAPEPIGRLAAACLELRTGVVAYYIPPKDICGCGRCGR